jgi:putative methyltransferase (TIGR04325 family)
MPPKRMLQSLTPPLLWTLARNLKRRWFHSVDHYSYAHAPDGWSTRLPDAGTPESYWTNYLHRGRVKRAAWIAQVREGKAATAEYDIDLKRITLGYVLALIARDHHAISVLDYGGGLGEDYWVGRMLVPDLTLDYHCKEFPALAEAGRALSPEVKWHTDDACFQQQYDLVMFSSSLQYLADWKQMIRLAAVAAQRHLLITDIPIVRDVATFVATERTPSGTNLHWILNLDELVAAVDDAGFSIVRELGTGDYPDVANAPQQPTCAALLFNRRSSRAA